MGKPDEAVRLRQQAEQKRGSARSIRRDFPTPREMGEYDPSYPNAYRQKMAEADQLEREADTLVSRAERLEREASELDQQAEAGIGAWDDSRLRAGLEPPQRSGAALWLVIFVVLAAGAVLLLIVIGFNPF